jgi:16S rRNA processing protein RimM
MSQAAESNSQGTVPIDLVELGYITGAYGIRGWVKIQPHSAQADALLSTKRWWLQAAQGPLGHLQAQQPLPSAIAVAAAKVHSGTVVAQFANFTDRDAAEAYKGYTVWVSRAEFPPSEDGEYYWVDLIGANAENLQGEALGEIVGLIDNGAHQILRVQYAEVDAQGQTKPAERLIPFVGHYVQAVNLAEKRVVLDWGLDF